jgi:NAD(P)-dependent dehydrogenase (short-subunit alcohol dehydrogenase family)
MPTPRAVLVTGANSGIGLAVVLELARRGHRVVGSVRSTGKAAEVHAAADRAGAEVETVLLDVDDPDRCREVVDEVRPWALVNNAGFARSGAVEEVTDDEARDQIETLVVAPIRLARLALDGMRDQGGGRIVNVSSMSAEVSTPLMGWYQGAKRALEGVSDALRTEVRADDIHVSLIEPGMIDTPIWDETRAEFDRPTSYGPAYAAWSRVTSLLQPLMASPEAVARTVAGALEADRPRARYLVGVDAHVLVRANRWMPTRASDLIARAVLHLR